jgi:hypothetical protein
MKEESNIKTSSLILNFVFCLYFDLEPFLFSLALQEIP